MGLSRRLALLTAIMAVLLVLAATELSTYLSEEERLDDYRGESIALAESWAALLEHGAPTGDAAAVQAALARWPAERLARTQAVVFATTPAGLIAIGRSPRADPVTPTANDSAALTAEHTTVWRGSGRSVPWEVAAVLGDPHPWGVLRVTVSTRRLEDWTSRERRRAYLFAFASAILVATGVGVLTSRWVARPLALLGRTMARAHGGVESAPSARLMGPEEFRGLARRYNELRDALVARERESDARAALLALEERARGYDRLALAEQTSTEFAHEIGTPLNTVRGHLQLLRDDLRAAGDQPELERVQLVLAQVDRVAAIVRARLGARAWPAPALRVTDLTAVAQRILQFLDPSLAQAGLSATLEETVPALASCDPALVEQVLLNLLKNAIEALTPGGRIVIRTGTGAAQAWLEVADTGPGLAAQARQHLFEPFATTKEGAGTGLGLAVSRRLARASGGDLVHVPSARGTVWRLTLPVGEPHD